MFMFSGAGPLSFEERRRCFLFAFPPRSQCASNTAFLFVLNVKALLSLEGLVWGGAIRRWQMRARHSATLPTPPPLLPRPIVPFLLTTPLASSRRSLALHSTVSGIRSACPGFARNMTGPNEKALLKNAWVGDARRARGRGKQSRRLSRRDGTHWREQRWNIEIRLHRSEIKQRTKTNITQHEAVTFIPCFRTRVDFCLF